MTYTPAIEAINRVIKARERLDETLDSEGVTEYRLALFDLTKHFETILKALK